MTLVIWRHEILHSLLLLGVQDKYGRVFVFLFLWTNISLNVSLLKEIIKIVLAVYYEKSCPQKDPDVRSNCIPLYNSHFRRFCNSRNDKPISVSLHYST